MPPADVSLPSGPRGPIVIGTAGHIDHGKTSLIRALTGVDLDRLPEEKARGITIALGFTHLRLPSGREASFVDVPGHERLVRTMIAGATGLDAAMLCVSAVEGVMPQTREHLAILALLGVQHGVVVLTMADLVDEELLELARLELADTLRGTFLEQAPILATAAGPSPRGIPELIAALDQLPAAERASQGPFRLPVDRAFVLRGFGTVITGTVRSGTLDDGEEVEILPDGLRARVRGLQVHSAAVTHTQPGLRTALNLAGVERDDLERGQVVVRPGEVELTSILDARYQHLDDAPLLEDGAEVRVLLGTSEEMAVLGLLDTDLLEPGSSALIQLRTANPLVALPGDRFILRRPSPAATLGGGVVLDPWAKRARKKDHARATDELLALEAGDRSILLKRAGEAGLSPKEAQRRGVSGRTLGDRVLDPSRVSSLEAALLAALDLWHQDHPLQAGAPRRDLRRGPLGHLSERSFDALIVDLCAAGRLVAEGPRIRLPSFSVQPTPAEQRAIDALEAQLGAAALEGLGFDEGVAAAPDVLQLLLDRGVVQRVGDRVLHQGALADLEERVRDFLAKNELLQPADFKTMTGLSRRHAIPLLEWLDARRITVRVGDARRLR